jgi:hypothetical protein
LASICSFFCFIVIVKGPAILLRLTLDLSTVIKKLLGIRLADIFLIRSFH